MRGGSFGEMNIEKRTNSTTRSIETKQPLCTINNHRNSAGRTKTVEMLSLDLTPSSVRPFRCGFGLEHQRRHWERPRPRGAVRRAAAGAPSCGAVHRTGWGVRGIVALRKSVVCRSHTGHHSDCEMFYLANVDMRSKNKRRIFSGTDEEKNAFVTCVYVYIRCIGINLLQRVMWKEIAAMKSPRGLRSEVGSARVCLPLL